MTSWYTVDEARVDWPGAPIDDDQVTFVLDIAKDECLAFAPLPTDYDPATDVPSGHRWAQLKHARDIWNAQNVDPDAGFGDDTYSFALTPFPLERAVRARLRPRVLFGGSVG